MSRRHVAAQVAVAPAVELHDPPAHGGGVGGELVVVDRPGAGGEEDPPAGVVQPLAEVGLVGVDEERGVEPVNSGRGLATHQHGAGLDPAHRPHRASPALHGVGPVEEEGSGQRPARVGEAPGARGGHAVSGQQLSPGHGRTGVGLERLHQRPRAPSLHLRVLVQQQAVAPRGLAQQARVGGRLPLAAIQRDQTHPSAARADGLGRAVVRGVVENQHLVVDPGRVVAGDRVEAGHQLVPPVGVHHAVREHGHDAASRSTESARPASSSRPNSLSASSRALWP